MKKCFKGIRIKEERNKRDLESIKKINFNPAAPYCFIRDTFRMKNQGLARFLDFEKQRRKERREQDRTEETRRGKSI